MKYIYPNGLPFSTILKENLDDIYKLRLKKKFPTIILIDGSKGKGKTTLAVHIADYLNQLAGKGLIDLNVQIGMGATEFQQKLSLCYGKGLPVIIYDEAGDFSRRGSMTKLNKILNSIFDTFRTFNIIPILCLPNMKRLDSAIFEDDTCQLLIHIRNRNDTDTNLFAYDIDRIHYLLSKMNSLIVPTNAYSVVSPNFHAHSKNLIPYWAKELEKISTKGKLLITTKSQMEHRGLTDIRTTADKLWMSVSNIRVLIKKHHIKPIPFKNKHYLTDHQIIILQEYIANKSRLK